MKLSKSLILAGLLLVSANAVNASSFYHIDDEEAQVEVIDNDYLRTVSERGESRRHRGARHFETRPHREGRHHHNRRNHNETHYNDNRN
jgi:hypothetical protein